jgi:hypothetical protein
MKGLDHKGPRFNILIGGEGLSSRGHTGQGGERAEATIGEFQRTKTKGKEELYETCHIGFSYICVGLRGDIHGYPWGI